MWPGMVEFCLFPLKNDNYTATACVHVFLITPEVERSYIKGSDHKWQRVIHIFRHQSNNHVFSFPLLTIQTKSVSQTRYLSKSLVSLSSNRIKSGDQCKNPIKETSQLIEFQHRADSTQHLCRQSYPPFCF